MLSIRNPATAFACLIALAAFQPSPTSAQASETQVSEEAAAAAAALVDASIPGVVAELSLQLPRLFKTTSFADLPDDVRQRLAERMSVFPDLIQAAMEQRWVEREPLPVPPELRARLERMVGDSLAGRRGEVGAARPRTRDVVARALAERFTREQLANIGRFLSTPAGHALSHEAAVASVQRRPPSPDHIPREAREAIAAFADTPSGDVYFEALAQVTEMVVEQLRLNTMTHGRELMLEIAGQVCDVVGPSCADVE